MRANPIEREIKLRFASAAAAREALAATGAARQRPRELQDDRLLDWPDGRLRARGCTLRVRDQAGRAALTFKGPPQPGDMKVREELETAAGDAALLVRLLEQLGLRVWFRYQKYRQEYALPGVVLTVDETPIGTFVELEGDEQGIRDLAAALGRTPRDYVVDSYYRLFVRSRGNEAGGAHMVFDAGPR